MNEAPGLNQSSLVFHLGEVSDRPDDVTDRPDDEMLPLRPRKSKIRTKQPSTDCDGKPITIRYHLLDLS